MELIYYVIDGKLRLWKLSLDGLNAMKDCSDINVFNFGAYGKLIGKSTSLYRKHNLVVIEVEQTIR